jgi:hypothetical protein
MVTIFLLGVLATKAEPALNVLGDTVETLSGGKFTKRALIWAVCVGVAVGMCAGRCSVLMCCTGAVWCYAEHPQHSGTYLMWCCPRHIICMKQIVGYLQMIAAM